nr:crocetin glucosyltransferase, chloroplastic-like [Tanacetum cinerariifolium]
MGADVTFVSNFTRVKNIMDKQTTHPNVTFAAFPDGHDTNDNNGQQPTKTFQQLTSEFESRGTCAIADIISSAAAKGQPFDNVVYGILVPWAAKVAIAHGVKHTLLWCQPAVINLPGLPPLTNADLPSFFWPSSAKELDLFLQFVKDHVDLLKVAPRILVNTFEQLELEAIQSIKKLDIIPIGPLIPQEDKDSSDNYIQWLNTKPKSSVVYVSFGTRATDQMEEIATGLMKIRRPFLWVIRNSDQARRLSKIDELQKQGMIVDWCSQGMVLRHRAIRCFVMHGGWNSTMESLVAGVSIPMVVFPQRSDKGTNAKMIEDVWKMGVRMKRGGGGWTC